ncbi:MAG TPA: ATP-binding protein [Terriglobia bacterium]|nr:ATP-binding protein [Terriglobia bacterium]
MVRQEQRTFAWIDLVWLVFLTGLAVLDPIFEIHKQETLLAIGVFQIFERQFIRVAGARGRAYSVLIKILLATLLVSHTGGMNSSYYPIYYLPIITAAMDFGVLATLLWTGLAALAYCSHLLPYFQTYGLSGGGTGGGLSNIFASLAYEVDLTELAIRNLFFFLAAVVVNRLVMENRRQAQRYQNLAEALADTNRRLEEAQAEARRTERLAALGQLSAGLAHEVRNPLGVIKGSAEMLNKRLKSEEPLTSELAGNISSEVNRLNALVTRFLDFARPSQLEKRRQDITALVDRSLKAVHDRWPDAPVSVDRQYEANLPAAPVDAELCEQVFTNLILNAYESLLPSRGHIRVAISEASHPSAERDGPKHGILVEIEDDGPGIPAELREQIFNPFFTTKKTGTGLGLSIVSKIVDDHHGWIRVANAQGGKGKGTCFKVFLPLV